MKYPYIVCKNGVWYPSGTEVPDDEPCVIEEDKKEVIEDKKEYSKTEINRMPIHELKMLALENGIEDADEMTGMEIKSTLIELFNL